MQLAERRLFDCLQSILIFLCRILPFNSNTVDVLGHKYVFGPSQTHFSPRCARAKMSLSRAKNIFMPANINSIVILYIFYFIQDLPGTKHLFTRFRQNKQGLTTDIISINGIPNK